MFKKMLTAAAALTISSAAFAGDFRTASITHGLAAQQQANGRDVENAVERGKERAFALTGRKDTSRKTPVARQDFMAGHPNFRAGK